MKILIVESNPDLGQLWRAHLERSGAVVHLATGQNKAVMALQTNEFPVIVLDLILDEGSAFAVADFAAFRHPQTRVIFVTNTTFFSDGSIYRYIPNACAFLQSETPPEDLAMLVEHYGKAV